MLQICMYSSWEIKVTYALTDEVSAAADKKMMLEMYNIATHEPFSFLYIKLTSKYPHKMFMIKFHKYLQLEWLRA